LGVRIKSKAEGFECTRIESGKPVRSSGGKDEVIGERFEKKTKRTDPQGVDTRARFP